MNIKLRKKTLSGGRVSLYLDVYHDGKRHYEFLELYLTDNRKLNKQTLQLAENIRAKRLLEYQNSAYGFMTNFKKKANFITYFEKLVEVKRETGSSWPSALKHLKDFAGKTLQFSSIHEQWLEEFQQYLLSIVSPNSARQYYCTIKMALRKAVKDKYIERDPSVHVTPIKSKPVKREYLTLEELRQLAITDCQPPVVKDAFLFSCFTGIRLSDIENLTWASINGNMLEIKQKKTSEPLFLPLSRTATEILNRQKGTSNIIPMANTHVFSLPYRNMIGNSIKEWSHAAGLTKHITFHTSRHTFATLSLTQGADLYTVSKMLGHQDIKTTQVYAKIVDQKKQDAIDNLPRIEIK